jgi:hypothetical protein
MICAEQTQFLGLRRIGFEQVVKVTVLLNGLKFGIG